LIKLSLFPFIRDRDCTAPAQLEVYAKSISSNSFDIYLIYFLPFVVRSERGSLSFSSFPFLKRRMSNEGGEFSIH